jgi:hypothetical protein
MADLYVYYKVRGLDAAAFMARVRAFQAALAAQCGVSGQLKRRPDERDGLQTWMEVYPATDDGFGARLAAAVDVAGLADTIVGARHVETFIDLTGEPTPCA